MDQEAADLRAAVLCRMWNLPNTYLVGGGWGNYWRLSPSCGTRPARANSDQRARA